MKKLLLVLLGGLPALAFAQDSTYVIKGQVGHLNAPARILFDHAGPGGKYQTDSVMLQDGKFEFKGYASKPKLANLMVKPGDAPFKHGDRIDAVMLYTVPGTTLVEAKDSLRNAKVTGTRLNEEYAAFAEEHNKIGKKYAALEAATSHATAEQRSSEAFQHQQAAAEKALDDEDNAINKKFILSHPNSVISLNALQQYTYGADYNELAPMFSHLSPEIQNSDAGKEYALQLEKLKVVALGRIAPEFSQPDTNGVAVSLASFRGKYVLVDFWASWCGPCRQENPNVVKAYHHYRDKNFTILSVSLDRPNAKDKWLAAIHKDGLTWTHVSDLQFWKNAAAQQYGVQAIPQNFLLDPDGKIIGKNLRGEALENKLAELFGKAEKVKAER